MPELPEVQALAADLGSRLRGRVIERLQIVAFPALKTYDPPVDALAGERIAGVTRHGKFLDIVTESGLHLVMHLARAGWVRWRQNAPQTSGRPGHGPLATIADLRTFREALVDTSNIIQDSMKDKKTLDQIKKAGLPQKFDSFGTGFIKTDQWIETVYRSYSKK